MSNECNSEPAVSVEQFLQEVQNELDTPQPLLTEHDDEWHAGTPTDRRRRTRRGENTKPTALQLRYQRQLREARNNNVELNDRMSRLVAWTYIPGRDRKVCPPVVDLRSARLLFMDRFPDVIDGPCNRIGLTMFRTAVRRNGQVCYAGTDTLELFKDFSIRPHFRAGGLCLDSQNEEVFKTALALDQAMELVARDKVAAATLFAPPPVLFGFPRHYTPSPEWHGPMQEAVRKAFAPSSPTLDCLLSPGGLITNISESQDGFRSIDMEREGLNIQVKVPIWTVLHPETRRGNALLAGQPLADLPRAEYTRIREITSKYPLRSLEWLEQRILDAATQTISVEESAYDKATKQRKTVLNTWRCVPSPFVRNQMGRAVRFFLDMRSHLGRQEWRMDNFEQDIWDTDGHKVRVDVMNLGRVPSEADLRFSDETDLIQGSIPAWCVDLMTLPDGPWTGRVPFRGRQRPVKLDEVTKV